MYLKVLTNTALLARFGKLVRTERKITHLILECIAEIDARKLYLEKGYSSLYDFLTKEFGYSPSAALRRIEGARLLREVPELAEKIEAGKVNLSQLSKVQQAIRSVQKTEDRRVATEEKRELLLKIENTTQAQTEQILARELSLTVVSQEKRTVHHDGSITVTVTFSKEQIAVLESARDLVSHRVPDGKMADVITFLAQKEIDRRTKILRPRSEKPGKVSSATEVIDSAPIFTVRRAIRPNLRKIIFNQSEGCQFRDPASGRICGSKRFAQIDHRQSIWAGGRNEPENLQQLCSAHNRLKYRKEAGLHPLRR
jgi:hypothetical protein